MLKNKVLANGVSVWRTGDFNLVKKVTSDTVSET